MGLELYNSKQRGFFYPKKGRIKKFVRYNFYYKDEFCGRLIANIKKDKVYIYGVRFFRKYRGKKIFTNWLLGLNKDIIPIPPLSGYWDKIKA